MDMQKNNAGNCRKRKPLQRSTLVYSVKSGQHPCGIYSRETRTSVAPLWKAR